ncbi:hypothetical protein NUG22_25630, partial [Saccharothrix longispora]|nr:hypothetical protein [Saccharothrix longispora]
MEDVITVERVGCALLVAAPGRDRDAADLAAALAPERRRTAVVVGASAAEAMARLDPWVVADLDEQVAGSLRLLAPHAGAVGPAGEVPPARLLAERLGVEVVAPDNALVRLSGGSVFVSGPGAGWVAYRPGATGRRSGPRHPAPWWQELLPGGLGEQIPLGLWLRTPGGDDRADDPLRTLSPDPERLVVVVGAPGEPAPEPAAVADALRALPGEARDRTVLVCYGCDLAQALADELGGPVRALHGVPGPEGPVHLDERGDPTWRPFALESAHLPGAAPVVDRWHAPVASMRLIGPAAYRLAEGWLLDVVPRGLVARPDDLPAEPAWSGRTGPTADLVVAARDEVPEGVVAALDDLVRDLPADARRHLRVVPVSPFAEKAVTRLTELPDHCGPGVVVTADGRVLPAVPVLAAPMPIARFTEEDLEAGEEPREHAGAPAAGAAASRSRVRPDRPVEPVEVVGNEPVVGLPEPRADQAPPTRSARAAQAAEAPK